MRAPSIKSFMRLRQRNNVVLPQPEGPIKAVAARGGNLQVHVMQNGIGAVSEIEIFDCDDCGCDDLCLDASFICLRLCGNWWHFN